MTFSCPDYTVGSGVTPDPAPSLALAGCTADWELLSLTLPRRYLIVLNTVYYQPVRQSTRQAYRV